MGLCYRQCRACRNLSSATTETSPFKAQLGSGPLGALHLSNCPSAQCQPQPWSAGFPSTVLSTHTSHGQGEGLSLLVYWQRVALQNHLLEKTFQDLQE